MANWAVGTLRIRGNTDDVARFAYHGFESIRDKYHHGVVESSDDQYRLLGMDDDVVYAHNISVWIPLEAPGVNYSYATAEVAIKGGCFRDTQHLVNVARKHNVDFRLRYIESGNEIDEYIEIIDGRITKFCDNHCGNFMWECDFPNMG